MIKVLLADDNKMSLKYFSELIQWENYGYELVSASVDGENAWYDFQRYRPQVVIVDIQMPVISGIELAERILSVAPGTVILFLSSYSEFQYARAAVKLRVYDYLLKHETTREVLVQKLEEIREHLEHENEKQRLLAKEEITTLFLQKKKESGARKSTGSFLPDRYDCFFLELEHEFSFLKRLLKKEAEETGTADTKQMLGDCCGAFQSCVTMVPVAESEFLLITKPNENPFDFCCMVQRTIRDAMDRYCSAVIIQKNQSIQECASVFQKVRPFLKQIYFYPQAAIIESAYFHASSVCISETYLNSMEHRMDEKKLIIMDQIYQKIRDAKDYSCFCRIAEKWIGDLMTCDRRMVHPSTGEIVVLFAEGETPKEHDINGVYRWIRGKAEKLTEILALTGYNEPSAVVQDAVFLISSNYSDYNLNVEWIAEKLKISPSNLNLQFKKETGFTPWKVIVNTRLSKARELLEASREAPNQICYMTGYNSLSYFSKVFKKAHGMSPQEYRRKKSYEMDET